MYELAILAVLVAAVVVALRWNKLAAPENPVIVQRPGRYHITLAPQLDFASGFLETLVQRLTEACQPNGDIPTRYFQVLHENAAKQSCSNYLLAVAFRKGIYFLQAIAPHPLLRDADNNLNTLRAFSDAVLLHYPLASPIDVGSADKIDAQVEETGRQAGFVIKKLV